MTPEMVAYYRAMLLVGIRDPFDAAFDHALETEDPLSELVLSLCTCVSDDNQVLSVLRAYTLNYTIDEHIVRDLVLKDLSSRLLAGEMTRADVVGTLYRIVQNLDKFGVEPWFDCWNISIDLELYEDGIISEEVFAESFDAWWNDGKRVDVWELQRKWNKQNRKEKQSEFRKKRWNWFQKDK